MKKREESLYGAPGAIFIFILEIELQEKCRPEFFSFKPDNSVVNPQRKKTRTTRPCRAQHTLWLCDTLQLCKESNSRQAGQQPLHWFPSGPCPRLTCHSQHKETGGKKQKRFLQSHHPTCRAAMGGKKKKKIREAGVVMAAGLKLECTLAQRRTGRRNEVKLSRRAALSSYQRDSQIKLGSKLWLLCSMRNAERGHLHRKTNKQ